MSLRAVSSLKLAAATKPAVFRAARVHTSAARAAASTADVNKYIPGGPVLTGTVNDATTYPAPAPSHGSTHWAFERLLSVALVPITVSTLAVSSTASPILDALFAGALVLHSHIGFDACFQDYLHPRKFPVLGQIAIWGTRAATLAAAYGLYEFNTNDIGLTALIKKVWVQ